MRRPRSDFKSGQDQLTVARRNYLRVRSVPKARIAMADINGCYLEAVIQI